jgi:hypothetical protein
MLMSVLCLTTEGKKDPVSRAPLASRPPREEDEVEVSALAAALVADGVDSAAGSETGATGSATSLLEDVTMGAATTVEDVAGAGMAVLSRLDGVVSETTGDAEAVVEGAAGVVMGSSILVLGSGLLALAASAPTPAPATAPATRGALLDSSSAIAREVEGALVADGVGSGAEGAGVKND